MIRFIPALMRSDTTAFWRNQLPHWEVRAGTYFFTIRCMGSLPEAATERVATIHRKMQETQPNSEAFRQLQRQYFLTMEKYLDVGYGFCPFREARCCREVLESMEVLAQQGWHLLHYAIMPNHVHALFGTTESSTSMKSVWRAWKGRTARNCNALLGRRGAFWQRDWFDRWMRDEASKQKTIDYIRNNPVKAQLVKDWRDYPWVR
jgi:REP element-mobilizing transposase RayT